MLYKDFKSIVDQDSYETVVTKNENGFHTIIRTENGLVFITGDKYDWQVKRLFSEEMDFNMGELRNIADCLDTITQRHEGDKF